ncbi:uncharacterized protein ACIBXB_003314 [Morphnus guianensis]
MLAKEEKIQIASTQRSDSQPGSDPGFSIHQPGSPLLVPAACQAPRRLLSSATGLGQTRSEVLSCIKLFSCRLCPKDEPYRGWMEEAAEDVLWSGQASCSQCSAFSQGGSPRPFSIPCSTRHRRLSTTEKETSSAGWFQWP